MEIKIEFEIKMYIEQDEVAEEVEEQQMIFMMREIIMNLLFIIEI